MPTQKKKKKTTTRKKTLTKKTSPKKRQTRSKTTLQARIRGEQHANATGGVAHGPGRVLARETAIRRAIGEMGDRRKEFRRSPRESPPVRSAGQGAAYAQEDKEARRAAARKKSRGSKKKKKTTTRRAKTLPIKKNPNKYRSYTRGKK
jgi:hypothetical protein